jgi:hypothetical protein
MSARISLRDPAITSRPSSKSCIASKGIFAAFNTVAAALEAKPEMLTSRRYLSEVSRERGVSKGTRETVLEAV